jgi:transcriptional regulator
MKLPFTDPKKLAKQAIKENEPSLPALALTPRQKRVVELFCEGKSRREIAELEGTAPSHISRILNHSDVAIVLDSYYEITARDMQQVMEKVPEILSKDLDSEDAKIRQKAIDLTIKADQGFRGPRRVVSSEAASAEELVQGIMIQINTTEDVKIKDIN